MKTFLLFTATGALVVLTSYDTVNNPRFLKRMDSKEIKKFVAHELPLDLVKRRYGTHFNIVRNDPDETDELRILDEEGERVFNTFTFDELGPPVYHDPKIGVANI